MIVLLMPLDSFLVSRRVLQAQWPSSLRRSALPARTMFFVSTSKSLSMFRCKAAQPRLVHLMHLLFVRRIASTSTFLQHGHDRDVRCSLVGYVVIARIHPCICAFTGEPPLSPFPVALAHPALKYTPGLRPLTVWYFLTPSETRSSCFRPC